VSDDEDYTKRKCEQKDSITFPVIASLAVALFYKEVI
jgi:hypothetical protein